MFRRDRLDQFKSELAKEKVILCPGDDNQLISFLRAGQGEVSKAMQVVEVFLQYQNYDKGGSASLREISQI